MKNRITLTLFTVAMTASLLIGCAKKTEEVSSKDTTVTVAPESTAANIDHGETTGRILKMSDDRRELTIAHANIGDWMSAMTMTFTVHDTAMISGIAAGDSVRFTVIEEKDGLSIGKLSKE